MFYSHSPAWRAWFAICLLGGLLCCCGGSRSGYAERMGILPLENLTGDATLDWVGYAAADVLGEELLGLPSLHPRTVPTRNDAVAVRATRVAGGYYTASGDGLELHLVIANMEPPASSEAYSLRTPVGEVVRAASELARRVSADARPYGTASSEALKAYALAIAPGRPDEYGTLLRRAVEVDPGFVQGQLALAQFLQSRGDQKGVEAVADAVMSHGGRFQRVDRARLELIRASGHPQDRQRLLNAIEEMAEATPADSGVAERLAREHLTTHEYDQATAWYRRAVDREPTNTGFWNMLAYAEAWRGDLDAARQSLERYRELAPDSANALDSLGEVHYRFGRFDDAARYFLECNRLSPGFQDGAALLKAARARFRAGDIPGADELIEQYVTEREQNDTIAYLTARWQYFTGRPDTAIRAMEQLLSRDGVARSLAVSGYSLLAVWAFDQGRDEDAARYADEARGRVVDLPGGTWASMASLLIQPDATPDEWSRRAEAAFPAESQESSRRGALAYALFFHGHYADAVPLLGELRAAAPAFGEDEIGLALGRALAETGREEEARQLLSVYPVVQPREESLLHELISNAVRGPNRRP